MLFCQLSGAKSLASFFKLQQRFYCTARSFSLLEDAEKYCTLRTKLEMQRTPSLGPLDKACLHLLRLEPPLKVSTLVLGLNALALDSHSNRYRSDIKELKMSGIIKVGKFTPEDGDLVNELFMTLAREAGVEEETLKAELFSRKSDNEFMLKRQLVGFFLLHDLEDGDLRLPVEAVNQLWIMHIAGTFTKEDDAAIEDWVAKNGPRKWPDLARILERKYSGAAESVRRRHQELRAQKLGKTRTPARSTVLTQEDVKTMIKQVLKQNPKAVKDAFGGRGKVDWEKISSLLEKPWMAVYNTWRYNVHPTLRRHQAGTLDVDVRPALIRKVKEQGWTYSNEVEFGCLVGTEEFKGHTISSLDFLYHQMQQAAAKKAGIRTGAQVTIKELELWWNSRKIGGKTEHKRLREQQIIESYKNVLQELKMTANL